MTKKICLLPMLVLLLMPFSTQAYLGQKTATLWGQTITYQLVSVSDRTKTYDGLSFVVPKGNDHINRVVINTVNFEKEALEIWNDFESSTHPSDEMASSFSALAGKLVSQNPPQKTELLKSLHLLKHKLQYAAWYPAYKEAKNHFAKSLKAKKDFVRAFTEIRTRTIEFHELSHLLDMVAQKDSGGKSFSNFDPSFNRLSEISAFITELAYGANPSDSLWQGVVGVIFELNQGKDVDSSLVKVKLVLEEANKFLPLDRQSSVPCLCSLLKLHAQNWALSFRKRIFDEKEFAFAGRVNMF